jgi:hypothetical protein
MALSMTPTILHATGCGVSTAIGISPSCSRARLGSFEATSFILARAALNFPSLGERGLRLSATGPGSFETPALIMPPRPRRSFPSFLAGAASSHGLFWCMSTQRVENELQGQSLAGVLALSGRGFRALALIMTFAASGRLL